MKMIKQILALLFLTLMITPSANADGPIITDATLTGTTTNNGTINGGTMTPTTLTVPAANFMPYTGTVQAQKIVTTGPAMYSTMNSAADLRKIFNIGFDFTSGGTNQAIGYQPEIIKDHGSSGWSFWLTGQSAAYEFNPGEFALVQTAPGTTEYPITYVQNRVVNSLDVTDATAGYGRYSLVQHIGGISNSSQPFGPGAPNDKSVIYTLGAVSRAHTNPVFTGGPTGAQTFLSFQNGPLSIGIDSNGNGTYFGGIDDATGIITWLAPICDVSEQVIGTISATVNDNVSTVFLTGAGSPTVTVTFPANPYNCQKLTLTLGTDYTAITLFGNGKTLVAGTIGVTAGSFATWKYRAADTTWYRVG